jgi:hypothetical protein
VNSSVRLPANSSPNSDAPRLFQQAGELRSRLSLFPRMQSGNVLHFPRRDPVGEALRLVYDSVAQEDLPDALARLIEVIDSGIDAGEKYV